MGDADEQKKAAADFSGNAAFNSNFRP